MDAQEKIKALENEFADYDRDLEISEETLQFDSRETLASSLMYTFERLDTIYDILFRS